MSYKATYLNDKLFDYLTENFGCDDEILVELKANAEEAELPPIWISPDQGKFMQVYLKAIKAKNVLEIGTLAGYSSIVMARALPEDGKVITIERSDKFADFAESMIEKLGYSNKIEVVRSDARKWVRENDYKDHFDFAFIDADKPGYKTYLEKVTPMLKKGGVFAADNAFAFGYLLDAVPERNPEDIKSMFSFNQHFRNHPEYDVSLASIGDGLLLGVKE